MLLEQFSNYFINFKGCFFRECAVFYVSEIKREAPEVFATPLQKKVYETLAQNNIPFGRVDTDPGITMEDCRNIDAAIGERIVKTVFLCNRQQTVFYLYAILQTNLSLPRISAMLSESQESHLPQAKSLWR